MLFLVWVVGDLTSSHQVCRGGTRVVPLRHVEGATGGNAGALRGERHRMWHISGGPGQAVQPIPASIRHHVGPARRQWLVQGTPTALKPTRLTIFTHSPPPCPPIGLVHRPLPLGSDILGQNHALLNTPVGGNLLLVGMVWYGMSQYGMVRYGVV